MIPSTQSENDRNLAAIRAAQAKQPHPIAAAPGARPAAPVAARAATLSNEENLAIIAEAARKRCPKCGAKMATGGTSTWVCLRDGTAAA
jgi:hypothetical protein